MLQKLKNQVTPVGIDLGTGYSCIAAFKDGKSVVIANDQGNRTTPSVVAFSESSPEVFVGEAAVNQFARNPANTIATVKRLIGRKFSDPSVQKIIGNLSYKVEDDGKDRPVVVVTHNGKTVRKTPEEISAIVLRKLVKDASSFLEENICEAVVTCPAYFGDCERQATKTAAEIAGIRVLRMINEPTAASMAYSLGESKEENALIFDLGSGTFDVTVLTLNDSVIDVRSTAGNTSLGGTDVTNLLYDFVMKKFHKKNPDAGEVSDKSKARVKKACERAKRMLSSSVRTTVELEIGDKEFEVDISRAKLDSLCDATYQLTIGPVKQALRDAKLSKKSIDQLIMVGGSTRIPKIQSLVSEFFGGMPVNKTLNPDEVVAMGAAVSSAVVSKVDMGENSVLLLDVTPLSLGIETSGGVMQKIIERNTTIPTSNSKVFTTYADLQTKVNICIYEGERPKTADNNLLGNFELGNIPPAPKGIPQIEVRLNLDVNGILTVTAKDVVTGNENSIKITGSGRLDKNEIEAKLKEAKENEENDKKFIEMKEARHQLEMAFESAKLQMEKNGDTLTEDERTQFVEALQRIEIELADDSKASPEEYDDAKKMLFSALEHVSAKLYAANHDEGGDDEHEGGAH